MLGNGNANVNLMEESVTQINGGIMINVDFSVEKVMYVKNERLRLKILVFVIFYKKKSYGNIFVYNICKTRIIAY